MPNLPFWSKVRLLEFISGSTVCDPVKTALLNGLQIRSAPSFKAKILTFKVHQIRTLKAFSALSLQQT